MTEFDQFWQKYPRRVSKLDAMKAFEKARRLASLEDILAGIDTYIANKPEYADYCHPSTWLNHGRWMDEPDRRSTEDRRQAERRADTPQGEYERWRFAGGCKHEPRCAHFAMCRIVSMKRAG